ncbi:2-succinyl-6-hydroxy-2,4-cyclohexadiene-1-carboxylate synthase [Shewanella putrefaciens]|uniref:Putative 2-succinyl-6-hydroxy-2,4-cyclohexadiene-1-carboxylate synthase n=1 Tax=Shewanella putrefaciens (strain CN-32 / ATCC BAA-453) TaxID=319224 RepID=A4Y258_SHEPC|nr:2-succinyl-6-hydroxy-2,4-cyclohexadiene-1-carboxylate synthase [Shewanella putrefaciens]QGS51207.1 2-succinyl-6-hydroxy-2,4-cyclohexadiene-1-carboxylate synthase [Shewanella putrefaciens]
MPTMARYGETSLPVLVLLHGFLGTKADWLPLMPVLSQHFHCICVDLPGHGDNQDELAPTELEGFSQCVENVIAHLDGLHIGQFHLYGYSLGGRIALHLANTYPQRLLSLTLESCHPGLDDLEEKTTRASNDALWADRLMRLSSKEFLALWYQQAVFADMGTTKRQSLIDLRTKALDQHPKQKLQQIYLATSLAKQASLWNVPSQLTCECHFFAGTEDSKFSAIAEKWQQQAPILLHSIHGAGHNIHQMAPAALISKIVALLG